MAAVKDADLDDVARKWLTSVRAHRRKNGLMGKVQAAIIDTARGTELHLTEETTFKGHAGRAGPTGEDGQCPLVLAMRWMDTQRKRRKDHESGGKFYLESEDRMGVVHIARVTEVTIISKNELTPCVGSGSK